MKRFDTKTVLIGLCVFVIPLLFGSISMRLGKDNNWDLRNYHYYNAYAFLENRLDYDIAPAQLQTYYNPILDIPFYLFARHFSSSTVGFVFGYIHGFNLLFVLLLFYFLSKTRDTIINFLFGTFIIFISGTGPGFLSELGTSMNENITNLFLLLALAILVKSSTSIINKRNKDGYFQVCIAGFIMGLLVGLKLTIFIFAVSSAIFLPLLYTSRRTRLFTFGVYGMMGVIGFLISDGFWLWKLYVDLGNPLFPYYNNIFRSPLTASTAFLDHRFLPKYFYEYAVWPIITSINSRRVCEIKFFDIRFALLYFVMIGWFVFILQKKFKKLPVISSNEVKNQYFDLRIGNYLLAFFFSSYLFWMVQFSIYRYIIPLELLVPLCFVLILDRIFRNLKVVTVITIISLALGFIVYEPLNWGREPWSTSYIKVDTSQFEPGDKAIVVILGYSPMSYVIPDFPRNFMFIRPQSNFMKDYRFGLFDKIRSIVNETGYPIYILYDKNDKNVDLNKSLPILGIDLMHDECTILVSNIPDELVLCKVRKAKS